MVTAPPTLVSSAPQNPPSGGGRWVVGLATLLGVLGFFGAGGRVGGLLASSALVAIPAAVVALTFGVLLGGLMAKTKVPSRRFALAVVAAMTLLPLHVFATGWLAAIGEGGWLASLANGGAPTRGWLSGYAGAIVLHGLTSAPLAALLAAAALRAVDPRREEQALLEASATQVLRRVTLRDAGPALAASGVAIAVLIASEIAITDLLRVRTFAEEVYTQSAAGQLTESLAGGVPLLSAVMALAAAAFLAIRRLTMTKPASGDRTALPWACRLRRPVPAASVLWALLGLLIVVPLGSLVVTAGSSLVPEGESVRRAWSPLKTVSAVAIAPWQHRRELQVSLLLAAAVACGATLVGGLLAWLTRRDRLRPFILAGMALLIATPGPLVGVAVIRFLNQPLDSPIWWLGELYGTWFAPWLAQMIRIVPYAVLILGPAARGLPEAVIDAARADGAGPIARLLRVAAPLGWPGLAAAWLVAFALSVGELSATVLVVPPGTPPLSVRLLSLLHYGVEDRVAAICLVLVLGYAAIAAAVLWLLPRRRVVG